MSFTYKSVSNLLTKEECDLILNFSLENLILNPAGIVGEDKPNYDTRKCKYYKIKSTWKSEKLLLYLT